MRAHTSCTQNAGMVSSTSSITKNNQICGSLSRERYIMKKISIFLLALLSYQIGRLSEDSLVIANLDKIDQKKVCGDVNTDGAFDVSDPIFMLKALFLGGPLPQCSPQRDVPHTGQVLCSSWPANDGFVDCETGNVLQPGQDGSFQSGCPLEGRFVDNQDGTITDNCTGLMWAVQDPSLNWTAGLEYCENLELGGHTDWRMPNMNELSSLIIYSPRERDGYFLDPVFPVNGRIYWSSTTAMDNLARAYDIDFKPDLAFIHIAGDGKSTTRRVRAVRTINQREI